MNKILSSVLFGLSLFCFSPGFSNSFSLGQSSVTNTDCGATTDPNFCTCFNAAIVDGCNQQPLHPSCQYTSLKTTLCNLMKKGQTTMICKKYSSSVPEKTCIEDLQYWQTACEPTHSC